MCLRKWLVRLLVFGLLGACACALALYHQWTDPATVRLLVIDKLNTQFPGAVASLDSASLRILGGIQLRNLRLVRRDDPESFAFAYIPSAVLYHDKEHLLNGKLALRKVELHRPQLRAIRNPDGGWNLSGLSGPPRQDLPFPTLVIDQGTIVLEDRQESSGLPPVELTDIRMTVRNDPLTLVAFDGSARSTTLGAVALRGTWQRDTGDVELEMTAKGLPVTTDLVRRLASKAPEALGTGLQLDGVADLKANIGYHPTLSPSAPLDYNATLTLREARLDDPRLPMPLEKLSAVVKVGEGKITVEKLFAHAGCASLDGELEAWLPNPAETFKGRLTIHKLPVTRELVARLPEITKKVYDLYQPGGLANATFLVDCQQGQWRQKYCVLDGEGFTMCYEKFPYPAEDVSGRVTYDFLTRLATFDLRGTNGKEPLSARGYWRGTNLVESDGHVTITGEHVPIDSRVFTALEAWPAVLKTVRSFNPDGRISVHAEIKHTAGAKELENTFRIAFHDAALRWDGFPFPAEQVSGQLDIYPRYWEIKNLHGKHNGGELWLSGRSAPRAEGQPPGTETAIGLDISGRNIAIDDDLRKALGPFPGMGKVWDVFAPAGRLSFATHVDRTPGQAQELDVAVEVHGCEVKPKFFPYQFEELAGQFRFHKNRLTMSRLTASHGQTRFSLKEGIVDLYPGGGYYADLDDLRVNPLIPDDDFVHALPDTLRTACEKLGIKQPVALQTRAVISQGGDPGNLPDCYWDGKLWLQNAKVQVGVELDNVNGQVACVGRHNGRRLLGVQGHLVLDEALLLKQPFHNVHAGFEVKENAPEVMLLGLRAPIFGGEVSGEGRIEFSSTFRYEMNLTAAQVQLEQFGRHNLGPKQELRGVAAARLHLTGQGYGIDKLEGNGRIDVPYTTTTKLYNLPLLLDLLKFLGLRWPDRTAFEELRAVFAIHGNRVAISQLDLQGNVISLAGKGEVNLDGTNAQLDFYPSWARIEQILPGPTKIIPTTVSQNLLKIEMRGKIGGGPDELQFHKRPLPGVVDPILHILGKKN